MRVKSYPDCHLPVPLFLVPLWGGHNQPMPVLFCMKAGRASPSRPSIKTRFTRARDVRDTTQWSMRIPLSPKCLVTVMRHVKTASSRRYLLCPTARRLSAWASLGMCPPVRQPSELRRNAFAVHPYNWAVNILRAYYNPWHCTAPPYPCC